ncbi:MAG: DUF2169 domain-containing protein [Byssovorax sp.]
MLEIKNRTPFPALVVPALDMDGVEQAVVVFKSTYSLRGQDLSPADKQAPLVLADTHHGEPGKSSIKYASDLSPAKPGTDVVLIGHAHAPSAPATVLDVDLRVGPLRKVVRVYGDRYYYKSISSYGISGPTRFTKIPLVYERAFGGVDDSHADPGAHEREARNDVGMGFVAARSARDLEGAPLPNLEDPNDLIDGPTSRPAPACFGFTARHWAPRARLAGTYDARWEAERSPFLPLDFDPRYHHGAHPDLISPRPLRGGEPVTITHVSPYGGPIQFTLPPRQFEVTAQIKGSPLTAVPQLDTVVIEPDEDRVMLTHRAVIRCPKTFLYIDWVEIV